MCAKHVRVRAHLGVLHQSLCSPFFVSSFQFADLTPTTSFSYAMAGAQAGYDCAQWSEIEDEDDNMLVKLPRSQLREEFIRYLQQNTPLIAAIVSENIFLQSHHQCVISDRTEWKFGDFNVCVPLTIPHLRRRLMLRCPFPFMLGQPETANLMIDEKLRCEAGTYAWISRNCPQVPILKLWGFGLPSGIMVGIQSRIDNAANDASSPH